MASTYNITEKDSQSWTTWVGHIVMKRVGLDNLTKGPAFLRPVKVKSAKPSGSPELQIPHARMRGCSVQHRLVHDFHVYDISSGSGNKSGSKKKLIYFAGGGFQDVATVAHWQFCAELTNLVPNLSTVLVSYPLTPADNAPKAYHLIQKVYLALLAEAQASGEVAIVGGDSAGGNLSLGLPLSTLKEDSKALAPAVILAISPAVKGTYDTPDVKKIEPFDPMLSVAYCERASSLWRGEWPVEDPRVAPLYGDLALLVERKVHLVGVIGKYDCLAPSGMVFVDKTKQAGVSCEWLIWDKQMHCFPVAFGFGLPEAVEGKDWIVEKLSRQK